MFQKISKQSVKFLRVLRKNTIGLDIFEKILKVFDKRSIEKVNFYLFLGKVVAKIRACGNNIIFLQECFSGKGTLNPPNPHAYTTACHHLNTTILSLSLDIPHSSDSGLLGAYSNCFDRSSIMPMDSIA